MKLFLILLVLSVLYEWLTEGRRKTATVDELREELESHNARNEAFLG
jgi:hypothetical protein